MWPFGATIRVGGPVDSLTKKGTRFNLTNKPDMAAEPEKSNVSKC